MTALAVATFDAEGPFARARLRLVTAERRIVGEWLPYATEVGSSEGARGVLPAAVLAGLAGAGALFALTVWSMVWGYPLDVGGRPLWSWPAYLPAPVEFGALAAALGGMAALFREAGLTRLHHSAFDLEEVAHASRDAFVLAVTCDPGEDANAVLALLAETGARHTRLVGA